MRTISDGSASTPHLNEGNRHRKYLNVSDRLKNLHTANTRSRARDACTVSEISRVEFIFAPIFQNSQ